MAEKKKTTTAKTAAKKTTTAKTAAKKTTTVKTAAKKTTTAKTAAKKTNTIKTSEVTSVLAPKTVERLEKISKERNLNNDDDDDDDDEDKIKIFDDSPSLVLDELDIHEIDKKTKLKKNILNDVIELK